MANNRHQVNAKSHERRTCKALGGERNGPNPGSDCVGTPYAVECKRQVKLSLRADHLEQARRQGAHEGLPWLLVLQEHGSDQPVLVMDFRWFVDIIHPLYVAATSA